MLRFAVILCLTWLATAPAEAVPSQRVDFSIQEQRLSSALIAFARQARVQILQRDEQVSTKGLMAPAVNGELLPHEALERLLMNTGLKYEFVNDRTVRITALSEAQSAAAGIDSPASEAANLRLGRIFTALRRIETEEQVGKTGGQDSSSGEEIQQAQNQEEKSSTSEEVEDTQELVVVTGTTIRGVYPESAPLDIYTAEDIALSGATTLNRFLETLPQNLNNFAPGARELGPGDGNFNSGGGIDLRGLGVGTTLVLLNGRRLTAPDGQSPDTSLIPLGAVERVEVLTDGASAVYGSDAIAGVINFILRDDFEGVNISSSYGGATRGGYDQVQADIAAGTSWGSGSGFLSYSHSDQSALTAGERGFASGAFPEQTLVPAEQRHSIFGAIDQTITDRLSLFGNILYTRRDSESNSITPTNEGTTTSQQDQLFLSAGVDYQVNEDLYFQIDGTYVTYEQARLTDNRTQGRQSLGKQEGDSLDLMAKLDGKLVDLPGGEAKFSVGGGYSEQDFKSGTDSLPNPMIDFDFFDRQSYFGFAEVFAPLVSEEQNIPGVRRLELSAAVRYTDYSDFGGAWTPRFGLLWSPVSGLNLRSTYARSFRAPTLRNLDPNSGFAQIFPLTPLGFPDPFSDDGSSVLLRWGGGVRDGLTAEFSDTITVGFDLEPEAVPQLKLSATYFTIDYTDRLGTPGGGSVVLPLEDPEGFAFVFNSSPTLDDFTQVLESIQNPTSFRDFTRQISDPTDPAAVADVVTVIFDSRLDNLAGSKVEGLDVAVDYGHETSIGDLHYGVRLTKTLTSTQRAITASPEISLLDTVGNPVSLRGSAYAGLSRGGFNSRVTVNYVDSYTNVTIEPEQPIDSWTTVDLNLRYTFDDHSNDLLSDLALSLTIQNLLDTDPPFVGQQVLGGFDGLIRPVGFDPVNANALGRFITIGLTKRF